MAINININLKAENAKQVIEIAETLQAHFGKDASMTFNAPRLAQGGVVTAGKGQDIIAASKKRLAELGLARAPKATSKEMALRAQHDATGDKVQWSLDLVRREEIMRDGYSYDIYADNKGKNASGDIEGEEFTGEIDLSEVPTED